MYRENIGPFLACKIGKKFAFYTVGISLVLALLISLIFSYKNYHDGIDRLEEELSQLEDSFKNSVALHLWQINMEALNIITNTLLMDEDIAFVKILDE